MYWDQDATFGPVEAGRHDLFVVPRRMVQLQRIVVEPPSAKLVRVSVGPDYLQHSASWLTPPLVVQIGTRITAQVEIDEPIESLRVVFIGQTIPSLTTSQEDGQHRLTAKECAKMLGATLGGLAMAADEETLREALAWWNWHPNRLHSVYEANEEIARLDAVDDARAAAYSKIN